MLHSLVITKRKAMGDLERMQILLRERAAPSWGRSPTSRRQHGDFSEVSSKVGNPEFRDEGLTCWPAHLIQ